MKCLGKNMKDSNLQNLIIRYLDNDLSDSELQEVKKLISENKDAAELYRRFGNTFNELKTNAVIEIENSYYSTIIPRFRQRLENKKRVITVGRVGIVFTTLLLVMFYFISKDSGTISMKDIADDSNAINTFLFTNNSTGILFELNQEELSNEYIDEVINEELGVSVKTDDNSIKSVEDSKEIETVPDEEIEIFLQGLTDENLL